MDVTAQNRKYRTELLNLFDSDDEDEDSNAENSFTTSGSSSACATPTRLPSQSQYSQRSYYSSSSTSSPQNGSCSMESPKGGGLFPIFQKNFQPKSPANLLKDAKQDVDRERSIPKKRKRTMLAPDPEGLTQMVLDAGQKHIGPKFCDECEMLYSPGEFQDEEEHRKAHIRMENAFKITLWKDARILFNFPDGCHIIMVQCNVDSKHVMNRLRDFLAWLDSELAAGYDPSGRKHYERIFLYVARTTRKNVVRILGCAITEIPDLSKVSTCTLVGQSKQSSQASGASAEEEEALPQPKIMVGITRLWTDLGFRRKSIASKICDVIRFNSGIPGCIVPKDKLGILEPSEAGRAFIKKYTEYKGVLYTYT